jgi:diguanylate cyclase (GGDEF)-like protein
MFVMSAQQLRRCGGGMRRLRSIVSWFATPVTDGEPAQYQLAAFSKQLPVLYGILMINTVALAVTHARTAPINLTVTVPGLLCGVCIARLTFWRRTSRLTVTEAEAIRLLRATVPLVAVLGASFTLWALSLYRYGDAYAKCHVAFFMSITVISCIFCLMHLRTAALLLTVILIVPFTIFFSMTGQIVLVAIALNFLFAACGMVFILLRNYNDFTTMILSRRELLARQAEIERLSDENFRLANMDALTKLPNRRSFLAQLDRTLNTAQREGTQFAVALIDLDGFKGVNDVHGHAAGDRLLTEVGDRLARIAGPLVFLARLGGDEFGVILCGDPSQAAILTFGKTLCGLLQGPYLQPEIVVEISGSAGLVAYPGGGQTAQQLFERADYALYHAKQHLSGDAVMFSQEHETMIRDSSRLEQALRLADLDREMSLAFQPIVDAVRGCTVGFEALARWTSPELGQVEPGIFIPVAERTHLIGRVTETLLAKALATAVNWPAHYRISINLSAADLSSPLTVAAVRRIVAAGGVTPSRIDIEITETAVMRDFAQASDALAGLRALGLKISLDDFGTGYSSLSHVHRLKFDKIKIDRSFVADINAEQASCDIVKTIVDLCRNLDLECIVEGVETEAQRRRLMGLGCRIMQGYFFSRPIPECQVAAYIAQEMRVNEAVV